MLSLSFSSITRAAQHLAHRPDPAGEAMMSALQLFMGPEMWGGDGSVNCHFLAAKFLAHGEPHGCVVGSGSGACWCVQGWGGLWLNLVHPAGWVHLIAPTGQPHMPTLHANPQDQLPAAHLAHWVFPCPWKMLFANISFPRTVRLDSRRTYGEIYGTGL